VAISRPAPTYLERPTGILSLHVFSTGPGTSISRWWSDSDKQIEESLREAVNAVESHGRRRDEERAEAERLHREEWEYARRLRRYLRGVQRLRPFQNEPGRKWVDEYVEWGKRLAAWIDPEGNPELVFDRAFRLRSLLEGSTRSYDYSSSGAPDYGHLPLEDNAREETTDESPPAPPSPQSFETFPRPYWPGRPWHSRPVQGL
jgi:hypothetical protein